MQNVKELKVEDIKQISRGLSANYLLGVASGAIGGGLTSGAVLC